MALLSDSNKENDDIGRTAEGGSHEEKRRLLSSSSSSLQSPSDSSSDDATIPTNVSHVEQLSQLPQECVSMKDDPKRPLLHVDAVGQVYRYALEPISYAAVWILLVETMERLSFYGLNYTQASYLTGAYDADWNANMDAISASTYVAVSVAVAYTTPFLGVALEERLGDYTAILVGCFCFYLPGVILIAATTIPHLWSETFDRGILSIGLLVLWPTGTGIVKALVNVFGARQFHPIFQSSCMESYYVKFYMCINIGALVGGIVVPILAQTNVTCAYAIPAIMLTVGILLFVAGTPRYVRTRSARTLSAKSLDNASSSLPMSMIFRVCFLVIPFNIAYSQMSTTFILQGTVMSKAWGWLDAASMNNADAVAVLVVGHLVGNVLYPYCAEQGWKWPTTYKFALGSMLGVTALAWALLVETWIHVSYVEGRGHLSILWQAPSYILIGCGEIFAVSAAYEVAFTASPPDQQVLASAVNLFCIGGLPNLLCVALYQACQGWFRNARGTTNISQLEDYVTAHVSQYFWVLLCICAGGVVLNILPAVREFVDSLEQKAADVMMRTPPPPKTTTLEESPIEKSSAEDLLNMKRRKLLLQYGTGSSICRLGDMRAGSVRTMRYTASQRNLTTIKRKVVRALYRSGPSLPLVVGKQGSSAIPTRKEFTRTLSLE